MMIKHLTLADLERYLQGEERSGYFRQHLKECEECRDKFRDISSLRHLARFSREEPGYQAKPSGKMAPLAVRREARHHISEQVMASYYDGTLAAREMDRVRGHLDGCSRCLNEYLALRRSDRTPAIESPSNYAVGEVLSRFPGRTRRISLGRARIEKFLDGLRIILVPVPEPAPDLHFQAADSMDVFEDREISLAVRSYHRPEQAPLLPMRDETISLEAGDLKIFLRAGKEKKDPVLLVRALDRESGKPAPGIPLKISTEEGYPSRRATGPDGRASINITPGRSRLEVDAGRIFTLDLDFPE